MKPTKIVLAALAVSAIAYAGCSKFRSLANIQRDIPYSYQTDSIAIDSSVSIPPQGISISLPKFGIATNADAELSQAGSSEELIIHVKPSSLNLELLNPPTANFNFVDTVRLYLSAGGQPEILAAYKYGIPKNVKMIDLDVEDVNIKDYFKQDSMFFRIEGHFTDLPADDAQLKINTVFNVLANPLN